MSIANFPLTLTDTYARELDGAFVPWQAARPPAPRVIVMNRALADELGIDAEALAGADGARWLSGNDLPPSVRPIALAYAGHQFGGFSPQLGDGRALLLGELVDRRGRRRDLHLKGSGPTPFARGGDGKAALGPMLREYLMGEAMHALGIPTTRALAVVATGEAVLRERPLPGALVARVAASHLRVGTFEYFSARDDRAGLTRLLDHAIARHDPELADHPRRALALLSAVAERQAKLVARWMAVGFIHGVMNTDNVTISGETIDYGPCAFLDAYDPRAVFSSIDRDGRYAFSNQPRIAQWNLARFGEALLPLIADDQEVAIADATAAVSDFGERFSVHYLSAMAGKLGLSEPLDEGDVALIRDYLALLATHQVDYTQGLRALVPAANGDDAPQDALFPAGAVASWRERWRTRLGAGAATAARAMSRVNPAFIARNHRVEEALTAAVERDDLAPFHRLLAILARPFDEQPEHAAHMQAPPRAQQVRHRTFCGT